MGGEPIDTLRDLDYALEHSDDWNTLEVSVAVLKAFAEREYNDGVKLGSG